MEPLVSICIPAYNNADYITETLDAVRKQTYPKIEIIVVDDCSTDGTWEILTEYRDTHRFGTWEVKRALGKRCITRELRIERNPENLGMAGNWNRCLSLCSGEFIKLLCADDLIEKTMIAREVSILTRYPEVLTVSTDTRFIDQERKSRGFYRRYFKRGIIRGKEAALFSVFTRDFLGAPLANTFRASGYRKIGGFDPAFSYIIDYDFFMRIYLSGKVYILHEPLNQFRIRSDSNTGQVLGGGEEQAYIDEHRRLLEKHKTALGLHKVTIALSVLIRRVMIVLGNLYLRVSLRR